MLAAFFFRLRHWQIFLGFVALIVLKGFADVSPFVMLASVGYLLWFWILGSCLNSVVHPDLRPSQAFFRVSIIYVIALALLFEQIFLLSRTEPGLLLALISLAIVCEFHILHFLAKNLALAETTRPVTVGDYIWLFLLFWFYPIGVWFLQPRINALYEATLGAAQEAAQN